MRKTEREMTTDPVILKILEELRVQRKTEREMEVALGLSNGTFTRWKYMNGKSYTNHMESIAKYLNVTEEYLLDGKTEQLSKDTLTPTEFRLIVMYRRLDSRRKKCLLETTEYFLNSKKYEDNETKTTKSSGETPETDEKPLS